MNDNVKQSLANLLRSLEGGDPNREVSIFFEGATWDFKACDLKDIFLTALFEVPTLRKELDAASKDVDAALKDVETLQEQIARETPSFVKIEWEYRFLGPIYNTTNEQLETQLNEMGRDGWELVNIEWEMNVEFEHGRAIFKRQK